LSRSGKGWFGGFGAGEFEIFYIAEIMEFKTEYENGMNRKETVCKLLDLLKNNGNKPLVIKSKSGEEARLGKKSINKLVSEEAIKKSVKNGFTREQHFFAAADICSLFRNSIKVSTRPDKSGDPNVKAMHRFSAPLFENDAAYITVKESTEHGSRIYTVELMEMGKLEGY
jgi:hypothetical protein